MDAIFWILIGFMFWWAVMDFISPDAALTAVEDMYEQYKDGKDGEEGLETPRIFLMINDMLYCYAMLICDCDLIHNIDEPRTHICMSESRLRTGSLAIIFKISSFTFLSILDLGFNKCCTMALANFETLDHSIDIATTWCKL